MRREREGSRKTCTFWSKKFDNKIVIWYKFLSGLIKEKWCAHLETLQFLNTSSYLSTPHIEIPKFGFFLSIPSYNCKLSLSFLPLIFKCSSPYYFSLLRASNLLSSSKFFDLLLNKNIILRCRKNKILNKLFCLLQKFKLFLENFNLIFLYS